MPAPPLTSHELSSVAGYMSIACWVIVLWENYMLKSGEGLSVAFILLWLGGDLTNLFGGVLAHVLPTMIILAVYYTVCDFVLLGQVYHYRKLRARRALAASERAPLLEAPEPDLKTLKPILPAYIMYPFLISLVCLTGWVAWYFTDNTEVKIPEKLPGGVELEWKSQVLGYASCLLYLGSRVPQIFHNFDTRCEGLSLAMFFFSISGNVTYVASILFTSMEWKYLVTNASWIAGAALTVFLDLFVLGQFAYYKWEDNQQEKARPFADDDLESV